jgi:hypothetical protein
MCPFTDEYESDQRDGWTRDWPQTLNMLSSSNNGGVLPASLLGWTIESPEHFRDMWISIVQAYTARNLTFAADRALAVSGIARRVAAMDRTDSSATYLAGSWLSLFPFDLTWATDARSERSNIGNMRRPPTWSWTSVDTPVSFEYDLPKYKSLVQLIGHRIELRHENAPFGDVLGATLTISARIFTAKCRITDRKEWHGTRLHFNAAWKKLGQVYLDAPMQSQGRRHTLTLVVLVEHNSSNSCEVSGLVVAQELSPKARRIFTRLGYWKAFQVFSDGGSSAKRAKMMRSFTKFEFETFELV